MHVDVRDFKGAEQWCPVKGGCISEVSINRGYPIHRLMDSIYSTLHRIRANL